MPGNNEKQIAKTGWLRRGQWIFCLISIIAAWYLINDYRGPREIPLQVDTVSGLPCMRANDLLVQEYDADGNLWATRGMIAYRLNKDSSVFTRQYHIPTGFSIFWFRNFSIVRRLTNRPECVELLPMPQGEACAMSAGRIWYRSPKNGVFQETLTLLHYGLGDQGIRHNGLARLSDGTILLGEYFGNTKRQESVWLLESQDNGKTWKSSYEFKPDEIRHVHAIQQDPYDKKAWILTGDRDQESMIAWSDDNGKTLNPIGRGSQVWRATQLAFSPSAIYWGADTGNWEHTGIYRWDRKKNGLSKISDIKGVIMYATSLKGGTMVFSASRVGVKNEPDDKIRLWIINKEENVVSLEIGTRRKGINLHEKFKNKFIRVLLRRKFGKVRFPRSGGGVGLAVTCLNLKEFGDGDLIILSEQVLRELH